MKEILTLISILLFIACETKVEVIPAEIANTPDRHTISIAEKDTPTDQEKLKEAVNEINQFFTHRDKIKKTNYFVKCSAIVIKKTSFVTVQITKNAEILPKDDKLLYFSALYTFSKLRAKANGLSSNIQFRIINSKNDILAHNDKKELKIK